MITRPKIVRNHKKNNTVKQIIQEVHKEYVTVMSRKGNTYNANLSDKVKLKFKIQANDTAIIDTDTWKVIDIIKQKTKPVDSEEDEQAEIDRLEEEAMQMGYNY